MAHGGRAKDTRHKLQQEGFRLARRKDMFVVGRVRQWGGCPEREVVHSILTGFQGQARQNPQQPGVTLLWTKEH